RAPQRQTLSSAMKSGALFWTSTANMSVTRKALWYIESHLSGDTSLDAIADVAEVSRFHLSRAFSAATGYSITSYLRARRLSEAAKSLAQGAPDILAVALDAGYGSHEAFLPGVRHPFFLPPGHPPRRTRRRLRLA